MTKKWIKVKFEVEGIHAYANAPDEVAFLRQPHRHIFGFTVKLEVFHDDRDVEFFMLKRELRNLWSDDVQDFDNSSCETLANDVVEYLKRYYQNRDIEVEVSEDWENSAVVTYTKEQLSPLDSTIFGVK